MACELLGLCWHQTFDERYGVPSNFNSDLCAKCHEEIGKWWEEDAKPFNPDFIHDANASRQLVLKVRQPHGSRMVGEALMPFITSNPGTIRRPNLLEFGLIASPKSITLARLVEAGKITIEEAKESV